MLEEGTGKLCGNDAIEGASNGWDSPSVVVGEVTAAERPATPAGEKEVRAGYPAWIPGAQCDGEDPAPYGVVPDGQYAGGRSDDTPVDGAKVCDTVAASPE